MTRTRRPHVWLVEISEFIPTVDDGHRPLRSGRLALALEAAGCSVHWWSSTFSHQLKRQRFPSSRTIDIGRGVATRLLWGPGYNRNRSLARLQHNRAIAASFKREAPAELERHRPDIVVAHFPTVEVTSASVAFASANGIPVLVDVQDQHPDFILAQLPAPLRLAARLALHGMRRQVQALCRRATGITGVSQENVGWGAALAGRPVGPADAFFPHGYPAHATAGGHDAARIAALNIPPGDFVVAFAGSFARSFDLRTILDAARIIESRGVHDMRLVLAGDGVQRSDILSLASDLPSVVAPGWLDGPTVVRLLELSHVGLAPYARNARITLSNKPFEYMAASLPIVHTLEGELDTLVRDEGLGARYRADDPLALADILLGLHRDRATAAEMGKRGRALFERAFTAERVYPRFAEHVIAVAATNRR
ncbi:MAG: glycosyltransferase family 4 protein [Gemmatimonadaceae bacterium]